MTKTQLEAIPEYTLPDGTIIELTTIPPFLIHTVVANDKDAPKPPMVEVNRGGKKVTELNYDDKEYKERLEDYENEKNYKLLKLLFTQGIRGNVEQYVREEQLEYTRELCELIFGESYSSRDMKYVWITSKLATQDDVIDLQNAIQELSNPTEEAIQESKSTSESSDK